MKTLGETQALQETRVAVCTLLTFSSNGLHYIYISIGTSLLAWTANPPRLALQSAISAYIFAAPFPASLEVTFQPLKTSPILSSA